MVQGRLPPLVVFLQFTAGELLSMPTLSITSSSVGSRKTSSSTRTRSLAIDRSSQEPVGQLITGGLLGESVGNKGAAWIEGSSSLDKSNKTSLVEDFLAVGGEGELTRRVE